MPDSTNWGSNLSSLAGDQSGSGGGDYSLLPPGGGLSGFGSQQSQSNAVPTLSPSSSGSDPFGLTPQGGLFGPSSEDFGSMLGGGGGSSVGSLLASLLGGGGGSGGFGSLLGLGGLGAGVGSELASLFGNFGGGAGATAAGGEGGQIGGEIGGLAGSLTPLRAARTVVGGAVAIYWVACLVHGLAAA